MEAPVLASTSAGQDRDKDSLRVGRNSTMSGTAGSSEANASISGTRKNSFEMVVAASRQDESASKKPTEKEDVVSKCPLKCAVPCCARSGERLYQTTFFPCPLEPHPSSRLWAKAIGVKVILKNMYICEDHFQLEDDLENYLKFKYYPRGQQRFPRFKKGVVPWKFPKCRGSSPTVHHHRVPFSKNEFYKRQRSRINKAREILSAKENKLKAKGSMSVSRYGYPSLLWEPSNLENVKDKTEHARTRKTNYNLENERNSGKKRNKRSSAKKRKSEKRENSSCSEKRGYFSMLNGDLSTLIAHVQPAICSWDVSEVRMDPPETESTNGLNGSNSCVENAESLGRYPSGEKIGSDSKDTHTTGIISNLKTSSATSKNSKSASNISESSLKPAQKFESALSEKSDEGSEDEIYMTPSEDEMNGYHDTSDTDFTVSSDESWGDYEIVKPTRRSARNRCPKSQRTDRYSPPIVLRSRAKKSTGEVSPVVNASETNHSSPKSSEKFPQPDKVPGTLNSVSGVSPVSSADAASRENGIYHVTAAVSQEGKDGSEKVETSERETVEKKLKDAFTVKSPGKENKLNVSPEKTRKNHVDNFLKNNIENAAVIRALSSGSSDSESIGDHEGRHKTEETSLSKSPKKPQPNVAEASAGTQNVDGKPKWRLRTAKPPMKGAHLSVDMSETVGKVFCPESQTSYSYKKVNVEKKPGSLGMNNRRRGKQDNFLLVRDGDQVLATTNSLPSQICGLISNMRSTFDALFDNLDDLKTGVRRERLAQSTVDSCLTEPSVDRLLDELKKYPDLLELEMAQYAIKCEKFYSDEMEKSLKNSRKIRWCNTCQNAARFHCCFSAAYCSRLCQSRDWGRHNRHCGQSRMLLDDPDLKLNPFMANRLKSLEYSKPTIGASMSNLEELHQSIRRPTNGQRILGSKNQSKSVKRGNASGLIDTSKPKVKRINYSGKTYPPASMVACASANNRNRLFSELQSEEVDNANVKAEPPDVDMEVERGSPPPRPKLVMGYSLVNDSSPAKTSAANQQVRITIPPTLMAGLPSSVRPVVNTLPVTNRIGQSNTTTVNPAPRITSVALVPRSTSGGGGTTLVIPKNTSPGASSTSPVTLRCRTVILPSGETQYIPLDGQTWSFKPNAQLVVKHVNQTTGTPVTVIKQAATSGSILITKPAKPAYSKFIPIAPSPTQSITSTIVSPEVMEPPGQPPPLSARLPKLTPVTPKSEPAAVRTLDSSELDKILSTDHLKEAFDMSYASNILRP